MRDNDPIWGLLIPWMFIYGVCAIMIFVICIDALFGLGLSTR